MTMDFVDFAELGDDNFCRHCNGDGFITRLQMRFDGLPEERDEDCPHCNGTGWITVPGLPGSTVGDVYPEDPEHEERCSCNQPAEKRKHVPSPF